MPTFFLYKSISQLESQLASVNIQSPSYIHRQTALKAEAKHYAKTGELSSMLVYALIELRVTELEREEVLAIDDDDKAAISQEVKDIEDFQRAGADGVAAILELLCALELGFASQPGKTVIPASLPKATPAEASWPFHTTNSLWKTPSYPSV